ALIERHDVLRTAVLWKELPRAVQVVYRNAVLPIHTLTMDEDQQVIDQLRARMAPGRLRIDLQSAPLIRAEIAQAEAGQWYVLLYHHHIISAHVALEQIQPEMEAPLRGETGSLSKPVPYREYVAEALARTKSHDANAFFRSKL